MRGNTAAVSTEQHFYSSMKPRWRCLERSTSFVPYLLYRDGIVHAEVRQEDGDFFHLTCLSFQQTDTHVVTLQCLLHVTLKQQNNIHIFMSTGQKFHTSNHSLSVNVISLNILVSICKSAPSQDNQMCFNDTTGDSVSRNWALLPERRGIVLWASELWRQKRASHLQTDLSERKPWSGGTYLSEKRSLDHSRPHNPFLNQTWSSSETL